jgi:16S rRNA (cytidine1402-2'-O)-methyltransferase
MSNGKFYLIPVPLSGADVNSLSSDSITAVHAIRYFIAERAKSARAYLKAIQHPLKMQELEVLDLPRKNDPAFNHQIIQKLKSGKDIALVSEAGLPCIADPGYELVRLAHSQAIGVVPFAGLMASGIKAQEFHFHGYLPSKKEGLRDKLIQIINELKKTTTTQLFMETPYRNKQVLEMIKHNVPDQFDFCIAADLSTSQQLIKTKKVKDWKEEEFPEFYDKPAIFILGSGIIQ